VASCGAKLSSALPCASHDDGGVWWQVDGDEPVLAVILKLWNRLCPPAFADEAMATERDVIRV
jgi:hypothetical protein